VDELAAMLQSSPFHLRLLQTVASLEVPEGWVAAGAIRDYVWDVRFGHGFDAASIKDVDVVYFDPADLSPERDEAVEAALRARDPDVPWEAKNQAAVHLWYPDRFGLAVEPLTSIDDALATFPETATAVAARWRDSRVEIAAPLGLDDLFGGVWRHNPQRCTPEEARLRLERKDVPRRWPGLRVVDGGL
jgi:hypothetical protein